MDAVKYNYTMAILTVVSIVLSILMFLLPKEFEPLAKSRFLKGLYRLFSSILVRAGFIILAFIFAALLIRSIFFRPTETSTASPSVSIYIPTAVPSGLDETPLYTLDPIIINEDAFFINNWELNKDLKVDGEIVPYGIGVKIPEDDQAENNSTSPYTQVPHSEEIKYKLCKKYDTLDFSYGIDDSTFDDLDKSAPLCKCSIVLKSISSDEALSEKSAVIFDSKDFYYYLIKHSVSIDVSQVEILSLEINWEYTPDPTKQNCFNLAIIDPVLYLKKT